MPPCLRPMVFAALLAATAGSSYAQPTPTPADTTPLEFHGFRAGARLGELQALLHGLDGTRLRCARARADHRVTECRAVVNDPGLGGAVKLWISAVDSVASVITLSTDLDSAQLGRWRESIERRYGRVDARVQGAQWMMQWVRRGRMLRLTWRIDRGARTASVSLVDGRVLDAWGRQRRR